MSSPTIQRDCPWRQNNSGIGPSQGLGGPIPLGLALAPFDRAPLRCFISASARPSSEQAREGRKGILMQARHTSAGGCWRRSPSQGCASGHLRGAGVMCREVGKAACCAQQDIPEKKRAVPSFEWISKLMVAVAAVGIASAGLAAVFTFSVGHEP